MERIHIDRHGANAVEAYLEYRRIVGEDDGGRLFSEDEYTKYKETVVPRRTQNRLYVSFGVPGQIDCKLIGPETPCFCTHRYKQHCTDFEVLPKERPILLPCRVRGCQCVSYQYIHINASKPVRCQCKHAANEHSEAPGHPCKKCTYCTGYRSPFTCGCGQPGYAHVTLVETGEERMSRGRPVGKAVPYAAMGGLTGFSSLAEGYLRLDPSGIGPLSSSMLKSDELGQDPDNVYERPDLPLAQTTGGTVQKKDKHMKREEMIQRASPSRPKQPSIRLARKT